MTGAGRSTAAKELEDLGFYVVDNLPPSLLKDVVRAGRREPRPHPADRGRRRRPLGLVLRVAGGQPRATVPPAGTPPWSSSTPTTRCSYAARRPPAARTRSRARAGCSTVCSGSASCSRRPARRRRPGHRHLGPQRPPAHRPDRRGVRHAGDDPAAGQRGQLRLQVRHPGRRRLRGRHAVPAQPALGPGAAAADRAGGARVGLRAAAGRARRSSWRPYAELLAGVADGYLREGKRFAQVAIGCTGGKHRSVAMSEEIVRRLTERGVDARAVHRDLGRE